MDPAARIVLGIYGLIGLFVVVALIFLIDKRIRDKRNEDFEKRDN